MRRESFKRVFAKKQIVFIFSQNFALNILPSPLDWKGNVMVKPTREELDSMRNICEAVLSTYLGEGITHQALADLTGTDISTINRRKYGTSQIKGAAQALYNLILQGHMLGMADEIHKCLESIPPETRSETKALAELILFFSTRGKVHVVRKVLKGELEDAEEDEEEAMVEPSDDLVAVFERSSEGFERHAKRTVPDAASWWRIAAAQMASVITSVRKGMEAERLAKEKAKKDKSKSEDADKE